MITPDNPFYDIIVNMAKKNPVYNRVLGIGVSDNKPDVIVPMFHKNRITLPCVYEGAIIEWCNTCNGEMRHVRDCEIHEKCTRGLVSDKVQACNKCKDYQPENVTSLPVIEKPIDKQIEESKPMEVNSMAERRKKLIQMRTEAADVARKAGGNINQDNGKITVTKYPFSSKIVRLKQTKPNQINWVCAITSVPQRTALLEKTLDSINSAGFPQPRIFLDVQESLPNDKLIDLYKWYISNFTNEVTIRTPNIRAFGNWFLALSEMYIRNPTADRYVLFQDDIVLSKNVRQYLEFTEYPENGYLNLITYPQNEAEKRKYFDKSIPEKEMIGWYKSNQLGKGAQALVFDKQTLLEVLSSEYLLKRPQDTVKGHQNIDGGLAVAMKMKQITEYVHSPSLVRHTGSNTSIFTEQKGTDKNAHPLHQPLDLSFRGENWDALELVKDLI